MDYTLLRIENKMDLILKKLDNLEKRLNIIDDKANKVKVSCEGMDSHITFIHNIYSNLRAPLDWITRKFTGKSLPKSKESLVVKLITNK